MTEEKKPSDSQPETQQTPASAEQIKAKASDVGKKLGGFFGRLSEKAKCIDVKGLAEKAKNDVKGLAEKAKSIDVKGLAEKAKNDVKGLAEKAKNANAKEDAGKDGQKAATDTADKPEV